MTARAVTFYMGCDHCGEDGVAVSPLLKPPWMAQLRQLLGRCPECGEWGRSVRMEHFAPDPRQWPEAADLYNDALYAPELFASPEALR